MRVLLAVFVFFLCISTTGAQNSMDTSRIREYEQYLETFRKEKGIPSISFAILKNQQLVYSNALGWADIENKIPATDTTVYSIASLTKPIAATLLMQLSEQGKLDIDKPIRYYWPGYDAHFTRMKNIFEKEIPSLVFFIRDYHFKDNQITTRQHLSHTAENVPGSGFKYNGFLYGRLSNLVDNITASRFIGLMDSSIFQKLQFEQSFLQYPAIQTSTRIKNLARPYKHDEPGDQPEPAEFPDPQTLNAGAGLICSVKDLAKFDIAFDKDQLLSRQSKEQMLTPTKTNDGKILPYGLGWFVSAYHGKKVIYHYGLQESFSGFYFKIPEKNITLILLTNSPDLTGPYNGAIQGAVIGKIPYAEKFFSLFAE